MNKFSTFGLSLTILLFALLFVNLAYAQEKPQPMSVSGGLGYFMFGGNILSIGDLNTRLENKGLPKFKSTFTSVGGGGHAIINNFVIGGEGHGLFGKEVTNPKHTLDISAGYGVANFGYVIYSKGGLLVYPMIGIGGYGLSFTISERSIPTFDDVLDSLKGHIQLSTGSFVVHIALGTVYFFLPGKNDNTKGGVLLGLQIGATFVPVAGDWNMSDIKVTGGPSTGLTGAYVRIMIGGGGIVYK